MFIETSFEQDSARGAYMVIDAVAVPDEQGEDEEIDEDDDHS